MKSINKLFKTAGLVIFTVACFQTTINAQESDYEFLRGVLTSAQDFTIEVFNAMPEEGYSFKPNADVRTFAAQAYHIAYSLEWYNNTLKGTPIQWAPGDEDTMSKKELVNYVTEQFDAITETIMKADEDKRFTVGVMGVLRHNSHHRGQMVSYLRMKGITPPAYK
jgi:uncharacterized damage-inducible protein DinB